MFLLLFVLAQAGSAPLDPQALPPAVTAAIQAQVPGGVVTAARMDGKDYEATVTTNGQSVKLTISAKGTLLETEAAVTADALPAGVKTTLAKKWAGWTISSAERSTESKGTLYEVVIVSGTRRSEVSMTEAGVVTEVEAEDQDDDRDEHEH